MLAPDPAQRFSSYAQLVDALQRARRALPDMARGAKRRRAVVIAALATALLAAGAAYYFYRAKPAPVPVVGTPTPTPTPDNTAALQRRYEEARRQLIDGKYDPAATALTRLASEVGNRQPLLSWIQMHRGLAALMQNKTAPARDAFRELEKPGNFSKADAELAPFFADTGKLLAAPGPIRGPAAEIDAKSPQAFATFLFGVKNWQIGEFAKRRCFSSATWRPRQPASSPGSTTTSRWRGHSSKIIASSPSGSRCRRASIARPTSATRWRTCAASRAN
jgi:hypothetical protein